jgi:hypothetical protein
MKKNKKGVVFELFVSAATVPQGCPVKGQKNSSGVLKLKYQFERKYRKRSHANFLILSITCFTCIMRLL